MNRAVCRASLLHLGLILLAAACVGCGPPAEKQEKKNTSAPRGAKPQDQSKKTGEARDPSAPAGKDEVASADGRGEAEDGEDRASGSAAEKARLGRLGEAFMKSVEDDPEAPSPGPGAAGSNAGAEPEGADDGDEESSFDLEEIERLRKLHEEEMERQQKKWLEQQKKRIAELGAPLVDDADKLVRLDQVYPVWSDPKNKRVVMVGEVCKRNGPLEMFACLRRTKEHESIVVVDTKAQIVHAGLLAVGAKNGRPVQYHPEYVPASGEEIEVAVKWKDSEGKVQSATAQDWIRHSETKKAMDHPFVFAGSGFRKDEYEDRMVYLADGGDFICVSNFGTAMLDLPVRSSSVNVDLQFEAFTERIPPEGTPVTVILTPKGKGEKKPGEK